MPLKTDPTTEIYQMQHWWIQWCTCYTVLAVAKWTTYTGRRQHARK